MPTTVIMHVSGEDPFVAEIENLPAPSDQSVMLTNPRRRDNKPLPYVDDRTISVIFPMHRVNFIEVVASEETREDVDLFFRT
jgi:hypothetical protein